MKTKSVRLKKYEAVYKDYIKHTNHTIKPTNKTKPVEEQKKLKDSRGRKKLTEYQKFVKEESSKEKYKGLKPDERLAKIARAWKRYNK